MTANVQSVPCRAFEVPNLDHPDARKPGAYCFKHDREGRETGIVHACPCGCAGLSSMNFRGYGQGAPEWDVQGEWPNATCLPSIGVKYDGRTGERHEYHWHGYLERGWFVNERAQAPQS